MNPTTLTPGTIRGLGLVNLILGSMASVFACLYVTMFLGVESLSRLAARNEADPSSVRLLEALPRGLWVWMGIAAVLAAGFAVSGVWLRRGEERGRTLMRWVTVLGLADFLGYSIHGRRMIDAMVPPDEPLPPGWSTVIWLASVLATGATVFVYPVAAWWVLRLPFPEREGSGARPR